MDFDISQYTDFIIPYVISYAPKVLLAIVVLIVGLWLIKKLVKFLNKTMEKKDLDPSLRGFVKGLVSIGLKILLFISIASMVGIETTSFIAVLGAAGLAVGLALQGSLANFAGGVLILAFKPFRVGDFVEIDGVSGTVSSISVLNTYLLTPKTNTAILPNGGVANGKIINYSIQEIRRVDLEVGIGYGENIGEAKKVIEKVLADNPKVVAEPAPFVGVGSLADSSVNLAIKPHCKNEHYWDVYFSVQEEVKIALDEAGIEIPFPQRDVHMKNS
jgi:small conductance mechanosensitive channel